MDSPGPFHRPAPPRPKPFLAYTVAFDAPGSGGCRQMARMLGASMARTFFGGDFLIVRNSPEPLFLVQREGLREYYVEVEEAPASDFEGGAKAEAERRTRVAMEWKAVVAEEVIGETVEDYSWVLFVDVDCLALRNLDHLFQGHEEEVGILYQAEAERRIQESVFNGYLSHDEMRGLSRNGINSGTLAVRADLYREVMAEWLRIQRTKPQRPTQWAEQGAWNRLVLDAAKHGWTARPFEAHEIQFPLHLDKDWKKYREAALLHCLGGTQAEKIEFMFGMYMQKFFHDPKGTLVGLFDM
jgi:hypothetical protein